SNRRTLVLLRWRMRRPTLIWTIAGRFDAGARRGARFVLGTVIAAPLAFAQRLRFARRSKRQPPSPANQPRGPLVKLASETCPGRHVDRWCYGKARCEP